MPFMQGDLAILSAEKYDDGVNFPRPTPRPTPTRTAAQSPPNSRDDTPVGKKRSRAKGPGAGDGDEEEKKRVRGRPRIHTNDETAAERRRTQIRLAQRAYRNRKETTIQTLEKKVQELKETNEEMSNAFMKLHDFALSQGLLDRVPELGRQLRTTTERFLALARISSEDEGKDDSRPSTANPADARSGGQQQSSPQNELATTEVARKAMPIEHPNSRPATLFGGLVVTHEPESEANLVNPRISAEVARKTAPLEDTNRPSLYGGFVITHEPVSEAVARDSRLPTTLSTEPAPLNTQFLDYEIVTYPTIENASFPLNGMPDPLFPNFTETSPYPVLHSPKTLSGLEITFGRRLQRQAVERALALVTMPNPEPRRFARVFGFCMLFEPLESIQRRLQAAVSRTKREAISYWQYPFVHLGGAGTHHFDDLSARAAADNNDATTPATTGEDPLGRPRHHDTGFSMGPFTAQVAEARDTMLDAKMRMVVPGFQGEFYDCDEVELLLRQRGVNIPAGADFVTVEVDPATFNEDDAQFRIAGADPFAPSSSDLAALAGLHGLDVANAFADSGVGSSVAPSRSGSGVSTGVSTGVSPRMSVAELLSPPEPPKTSSTSPWPMGGLQVEDLLLPTTTAGSGSRDVFAASSASHFGGPGGLLAFTGLADSGSRSGVARKQPVVLDVKVFLHELVERATCLGRTPGFRQKDVNAAFWIATRNQF